MDIRSTHKEILREQREWDNALILLRELVRCWAVSVEAISEVNIELFAEIETGMSEILKKHWGEKARLVIDRKTRSAHAVHPDGRSMNLTTGEFIEWGEEA